MNPTTTIGASGTVVLSVDSLASVINWLALHYQVTPLPDEMQAKAAALLFLATVGTLIGGVWWIIRAIARKWMKDHQLLENGNGAHLMHVINP